MNIKHPYLLLFGALAIAAGCSQPQKDTAAISENDIKSNLAVLGNDSLMGRKPFTDGETKTIRFLSEQYKSLGLAPGNNGSYFQDVPMVEITSTPSAMQI